MNNQKNDPKVSVLMSCRNSSATLLEACINSVLTQSFQDFEFVIVDDGSDKPIAPVVTSITSDNRISIFRIELQLPIGVSRRTEYPNTIIHFAGELIRRGVGS